MDTTAWAGPDPSEVARQTGLPIEEMKQIRPVHVSQRAERGAS